MAVKKQGYDIKDMSNCDSKWLKMIVVRFRVLWTQMIFSWYHFVFLTCSRTSSHRTTARLYSYFITHIYFCSELWLNLIKTKLTGFKQITKWLWTQKNPKPGHKHANLLTANILFIKVIVLIVIVFMILVNHFTIAFLFTPPAHRPRTPED